MNEETMMNLKKRLQLSEDILHEIQPVLISDDKLFIDYNNVIGVFKIVNFIISIPEVLILYN